MIRANAHKYSISAMCKCLGISHSIYYYQPKEKKDECELETSIQKVFNENRRVYGQRKIKHVLERTGKKVSCRKIGKIMKKHGLISVYTKKKYHVHHTSCNESETPNLLDRKFNEQKPRACVVSDLTYVRVKDRWAYTCILLDLNNREIIGYSARAHKDALLVRAAFASVHENLNNIQMFHTDRGKEFDNALIDDILEAFHVSRSLSMKGCPYDNAVAESTFKTFKAEFIYRRVFTSLEQLQAELADYVLWFNCIRLHGTLGYVPPAEYKQTCTL